MTQYPFELTHLLGALQGSYSYEGIRGIVTSKLIDEFGQGKNAELQGEILLALTSGAEHPVMDGPVPAKAYKPTWNKGANDRRIDMAALLPVLRKWYAEGVADPLAQRVIREMAVEYGFEPSHDVPP